jgi:hypothetical protein
MLKLKNLWTTICNQYYILQEIKRTFISAKICYCWVQNLCCYCVQEVCCYLMFVVKEHVIEERDTLELGRKRLKNMVP